MICYCGKEIDSSAGLSWQQVIYEGDKIVYAICQHNIVCIDSKQNLQHIIDVLEDLKISVSNEIVGFEPCEREKDRLEALTLAIEILKKEIK